MSRRATSGRTGGVLIVVSPAKALDFESPLATRKSSQPRMLERAEELVGVMAAKSPDEIGELMHISPALSELNFERFQDFETPFSPENARPAVLAFDGDTYQGLDAPTSFSERDFTHAQKVFRILSGLYGVLRPLDLIQPYRLEMGTKLVTDRGRDLYGFWGGDITRQLAVDLKASPGANALVNLASNEYFSSVRPEALGGRVITPVFLDSKGGKPFKIVSFFAKRARGAMAGWMIRERVTTLKGLTDFDGLGYAYAADQSRPDAPVFTRLHQD